MTVRARPGFVCVRGWGGGGAEKWRYVSGLGLSVGEGEVGVGVALHFWSYVYAATRQTNDYFCLDHHIGISQKLRWSLYLSNEVQTLVLPTTIDMWPNPRVKYNVHHLWRTKKQHKAAGCPSTKDFSLYEFSREQIEWHQRGLFTGQAEQKPMHLKSGKGCWAQGMRATSYSLSRVTLFK